MQQMAIFHGQRFSFDCEAMYFKRHKGDTSLAKEWSEQWNECAHGRSDGTLLDILWCPWILPE